MPPFEDIQPEIIGTIRDGRVIVDESKIQEQTGQPTSDPEEVSEPQESKSPEDKVSELEERIMKLEEPDETEEVPGMGEIQEMHKKEVEDMEKEMTKRHQDEMKMKDKELIDMKKTVAEKDKELKKLLQEVKDALEDGE